MCVLQFNFSGKLRTLPELHRTLRSILATGKLQKLLSPEEVLKLEPDAFGALDIGELNEVVYPMIKFSFDSGEFMACVKPSEYRTKGNEVRAPAEVSFFFGDMGRGEGI